MLVPSATVEAIFRYWEDSILISDDDGPLPPLAHKPKTILDSVAVQTNFRYLV